MTEKAELSSDDADMFEAMGIPAPDEDEVTTPPPEGDPDDEDEEEDESGDETEEEESEEEEEEEKEPTLSDLTKEIEELKNTLGGVYGSMKEEREAKQKERKEKEELLAKIREAQAEKEEQERLSKIPDKDEDPIGHLKEELKAEIAALKKQQDEEGDKPDPEEEKKRQEQLAQARKFAKKKESEFAEDHPEYYEAVDFLHQRGVEALKEKNPDMSEDEIVERINWADDVLMGQALSANQNPAELALKSAVELGFGKGEGDDKEKTEKKPKKEKKEAPQSTSLSTASSVGGGGSGKYITREEVLKLSPQERDEYNHDSTRAYELATEGKTRRL